MRIVALSEISERSGHINIDFFLINVMVESTEKYAEETKTYQIVFGQLIQIEKKNCIPRLKLIRLLACDCSHFWIHL